MRSQAARRRLLRANNEHRSAVRLQRWLYRCVAILKHKAIIARRQRRQKRQEEGLDDLDSPFGFDEEEEDNTFLTRFMERSGSVGEKMMMLSSLRENEKPGSRLSAVSENRNDELTMGANECDGRSGTASSEENEVDRVTKVQAKWHRVMV